MLGLSRWNPVDDVFNFQREADRLFNQFWNDLPGRMPTSAAPSFQVQSNDEGWRIDVPIPGIDPKHVQLEVAGNNLTIRAESPGDGKAGGGSRYQQTLTVPQFLDVDKLRATIQHGMLRLSLPLRDSVKPRRVQIETQQEEQRQLAGVS